MSFPPGSTLPVHIVPCLDCGTMLARKTYWRKPRCAGCTRKHWKGNEAGKLVELRQQARRYRIVMHVLGWEDSQFEEMLMEIRHCPMTFRRDPENRSARYDIALERRSHRRAAESAHTQRKAQP